MYAVTIEQTDKQDRENLVSYKFHAVIKQDGITVEETDFFGAEVKTNAVRLLTGSGLRIAYEAGSTVSDVGSIKVDHGDLLGAFAKLNGCRVVTARSVTDGDCEVIE